MIFKTMYFTVDVLCTSSGIKIKRMSKSIHESPNEIRDAILKYYTPDFVSKKDLKEELKKKIEKLESEIAETNVLIKLLNAKKIKFDV